MASTTSSESDETHVSSDWTVATHWGVTTGTAGFDILCDDTGSSTVGAIYERYEN